MRFLLIAALIGIATGCVEAPSVGAPQQSVYPIESSTIERFTPNSNAIELYTPGASEIGLYDPTTGKVSKVPATPEQCGQFLESTSAADALRLTGPETDAKISCSSRDHTVDCFCNGDCCKRTLTNCECC